MKNCRPSRYLNIIPLEKTYLLLNGFNGCMDEVSMELGDLLKNEIEIIPSDIISENEISFLMRRGHLTNLTEEQELKEFTHLAELLDKKNLEDSERNGALMLLMSYECNLDCFYCYQRPIRKKKANKVMSEEMIDDLFGKYYDKLFKKMSKENINITLYGGEPFLKKNRKAVERVLYHAKENGNHVGAISNCTHIDHFLDLLGPLPGMINFVQVSIDGDKENHDGSRISADKTPTFDTIIENIHKMLDRKVSLNIRINIEANSIEKVAKLYQMLEKEEIADHPSAYIYLHPLHNHFNQADDSTFMSHEETAATLNEIAKGRKIRHPIKRKAEGLRYLMSMDRGVAFKQTRFCMQNIPNNYLIDPYGDIYGCYEEAGRDDAIIGHLKDGEVIFNELKDTYLKRSILSMDECLECSIALLCGGECGVQAKENYKTIFKPFCNSRMNDIYEAVKCIYNEKDKEKIDNLNIMFPNL